MTHFSTYLPQNVELGAVRRLEYSTDTVATDGGYEVRNARWSTPLRTFEISFPTSRRDDATYQAVLDLYEQSLGGLHSFNFRDWTGAIPGETIAVRFDSPLSLTGVDPRYDHIETLTLKEVRL